MQIIYHNKKTYCSVVSDVFQFPSAFSDWTFSAEPYLLQVKGFIM
jgi:hypothetical protein